MKTKQCSETNVSVLLKERLFFTPHNATIDPFLLVRSQRTVNSQTTSPS